MINSLLDTGVKPINELQNMKPVKRFAMGGYVNTLTPEESLSEPPPINLNTGGPPNRSFQIDYAIPETIKLGQNPTVSRQFNFPNMSGIGGIMGLPATQQFMPDRRRGDMSRQLQRRDQQFGGIGSMGNFTNVSPNGLMGLLAKTMEEYKRVL